MYQFSHNNGNKLHQFYIKNGLKLSQLLDILYPVMGFHGSSVSPEIVLIYTNSLNYEGELELGIALQKKNSQ